LIILLGDAEKLIAFIEPAVPAFARLIRAGDKHHLSGIEKVKTKAVRVSMSRFAVSSAGLALPTAGLPRTYQWIIDNLKARRSANHGCR
jgi:hypothetical protein